MGKIMAVNISEKKGTQKKNVHSARLMEEFESRRTPMPASGIAR